MLLFIMLVLMGVVMSLPILIYSWRLKGKGNDTMGMGMGDAKFGQNLGAKHWKELNEQPEDKRYR
jgi:hypothetical protein